MWKTTKEFTISTDAGCLRLVGLKAQIGAAP
jgi:hypothetical protein